MQGCNLYPAFTGTKIRLCPTHETKALFVKDLDQIGARVRKGERRHRRRYFFFPSL
jgi:hypothetical protein